MIRHTIKLITILSILAISLAYYFKHARTTKAWVIFPHDYKDRVLYKMGCHNKNLNIALLGDIVTSQEELLKDDLQKQFSYQKISFFDIRHKNNKLSQLPQDFESLINFVAPEIFIVRYGKDDYYNNHFLQKLFFTQQLKQPTIPSSAWDKFFLKQTKIVLQHFITIINNTNSKLILLGYPNLPILNNLFQTLSNDSNIFYIPKINRSHLIRTIKRVASKTTPRKDRRDQWKK